MSQICKYVAIDGTVLTFGENGKIFMGQGDFRNFSYDYEAPYGSIINFSKNAVVQKQNTIYIKGQNENEVHQIANQIFNVFEKDIKFKNENPYSDKTGKLYIGDYYLKCFVSSSTPSCYLNHKHFLKKDITLITDHPNWIKETSFSFVNSEKKANSKKYPFKYSYAYRINTAVDAVKNEYLFPIDFEFVLEPLDGRQIVNPFLLIGEQRYQFNVILKNGFKLILNTLTKTISLVDEKGNVEEALYIRSKKYDSFAKIPTGTFPLSIPENSKAELTGLQERSEPEWEYKIKKPEDEKFKYILLDSSNLPIFDNAGDCIKTESEGEV